MTDVRDLGFLVRLDEDEGRWEEDGRWLWDDEEGLVDICGKN